MQNVKLLIVDDDEDDYLLARDLIEDIAGDDCQLDWASSFDEGQARLAENHHDLCLMDYKLGARDGIELLQQAQQLGFTGPVILLTGLDQGDKEFFMDEVPNTFMVYRAAVVKRGGGTQFRTTLNQGPRLPLEY